MVTLACIWLSPATFHADQEFLEGPGKGPAQADRTLRRSSGESGVLSSIRELIRFPW